MVFTSFIIFGIVNTFSMKILVGLFLFIFLSLETFAQKESEKPFGIRYYGYMPGASSRNISFKAKKGGAKRNRKWAYLDLQYRTMLFYNVGTTYIDQSTVVLDPGKRTNRFFPGIEARINIPKGRHFITAAYAYYMPNTYSILSKSPDEFTDATETLSSYSLNYSYLFTLGSGRKRQVLFFQTGLEFMSWEINDGDVLVNGADFGGFSAGIGHHFSGPWYWETKVITASGEPTVISLGLGYRLAIKRK